MNNYLRLLYVDDDHTQLWAMKRRFSSLFHITVAPSGRDALMLMEHPLPFDVVISDYNMPDMDGMAFLNEAMRRQPEAVRILVSGHMDHALSAEAMAAGYVTRVLDKAWQHDDLIHVVKEELKLCMLPK